MDRDLHQPSRGRGLTGSAALALVYGAAWLAVACRQVVLNEPRSSSHLWSIGFAAFEVVPGIIAILAAVATWRRQPRARSLMLACTLLSALFLVLVVLPAVLVSADTENVVSEVPVIAVNALATVLLGLATAYVRRRIPPAA